MDKKIRVIVWNENVHERTHADVRANYPKGIHGAIADALGRHADFHIETATQDEPEHGLAEARLNECNVLVWWGHIAHEEVQDKVVDRIQQRVLDGMGLIVLHSGHFSKIFRRLMGTSCALSWREAAETERIWVVEPAHPIANGLGPYFELPTEEMYGERFDIPQPETTVFLSWFEGGEVFRSGCCWQRGYGKVFYFRPGHESYPTYHDSTVQHVIANAVRWAAPLLKLPAGGLIHRPESLSPLQSRSSRF